MHAAHSFHHVSSGQQLMTSVPFNTFCSNNVDCTCSEEAVRQASSSSEGEDEPQTSQQGPSKLQIAKAAAKLIQSKKQKPSAVFRKKMKHAGDHLMHTMCSVNGQPVKWWQLLKAQGNLRCVTSKLKW